MRTLDFSMPIQVQYQYGVCRHYKHKRSRADPLNRMFSSVHLFTLEQEVPTIDVEN